MSARPPRTFAVAVALALPALARAATVTLDDALVSRAECVARSSQSVALSWDLGGSSGSTVEILGSNASGCSETDATTAVLVDGLGTSQTSYPQSGDATLTLAAVLSAAGKSAETCDGADSRVYVCVRLLDSSGTEVTTASATLSLQLERPPPPVGLSVSVGERGLYVSWTEGTATTDAPASSATYRAFASAGGVTHESSETSGTTARVADLENGTTYDVWVVAYSTSGNPSDASALSAGTPQPVLDFYDLYQASGGTEAGGCSHGGAAGLLSVVAAAWVVRGALSRRGLRRAAAGHPADGAAREGTRS